MSGFVFHRMDENILDERETCGIKTFMLNITLERIPLMEQFDIGSDKSVLWEIDEEPLGDSLLHTAHCLYLNRGKIEAEEDLVQTLKAMS